MRQQHAPKRAGPARLAIAASLRVLFSSAALVALYFVVPLDRGHRLPPLLVFLIALAGMGTLFGLQVRSILRSPKPAIRAVEALAASIPLLLLLFAATYFSMSLASRDTFSEPLSKSSSLYLTVTVFSTVGFGDITPVTDGARLVVSTQMILDLIVLGAGLRIIAGAVQVSRQQQGTPRDGDPAASPPGRLPQ